MLTRSARIRSTTPAERAARRQRVEDRKALHANLALVRAGAEPTVEPVQAVDENRKAWCRAQPCAVRRVFGSAAGPCRGPIDPDHRREGVGKGQTATDDQVWPCCRGHHDQRHDRKGVFAPDRMPLAQLRAFVRDRIAEAQADYAAHLATIDPDAVSDQAPGLAATSSRQSRREHLSALAGEYLRAPIQVGDPITLGTGEGVVRALLADGAMEVLWLDGSVTVERQPAR